MRDGTAAAVLLFAVSYVAVIFAEPVQFAGMGVTLGHFVAAPYA